MSGRPASDRRRRPARRSLDICTLVSGVLLLAASGCSLAPRLGPPPSVGPPYIPPPEPVWVVLDPAFYASTDTLPGPSRTRAAARPRRASAGTPGPESGLETGSPAGPAAGRSGGPEPALTEGPGATPQATDATRRVPDAGPHGGLAGTGATNAGGTAADARAILVDLPAADRRELERAARRNLAAADSLARGAQYRALGPLDREKLETSLGLVRQAEDALRRGDLRAAANLAYKARLLAAETTR